MQVVNKRTHVATARDLYIGRPSNFGNPFVIGKDGSREVVIEKYRQYLWRLIQTNPLVVADLQSLGDYDYLVCFCAPLACHGDVLVKAHEWSLTL